MILFTHTCFYFPLQWGAVGTFVFSTLLSLLPFASLSDVIEKISVEVLFLNACQVALTAFSCVFAITGAVLKQPDFFLPFLTFYVGYAIVDFLSIIGTVLVGYPFYGHNLHRVDGAAMRKIYSKIYVILAVLFFIIIFAIRVYFILVVYCYYEEMKRLTETAGSPEDIEETLALPNTSKVSGKVSVDEI